jgi:outer membrane autotransporter protein
MRFHHKVIATAIMLACMAPAQAQIYKARLSGANENPAVTTAGTGVGVITFNSATHEMRVKTTFSGLTGNTTASHIHCCTTTPTANAGVATQTPTFTGFPAGVTAGSYDTTFNLTQATSWNAAFITANGGTPATAEAALVSGAAGNRAYLNIHSSFAAGGEIRGNLVPFTFFSGATAQTAPIAIALDSLGAGTGELNNQLVALAWLEGVAQTSALAQLSPLPVAMISSLSSDGLFGNYDSIGNRLGGLRADGAAGSGNIWVRYANGEAEQSLRGRGASVDSDGDDLSIGVDYRLSDALLVGAAFGVQRDDLDYNGTLNGSSAELQNNRATLYGELALSGNAFLDAMLTMGSTEQQAVRNAGISGTAMSDADHELWGARVALGTSMALGSSMTLTPQARFDWAYLDMESYRETGAGPMSLLVNDNDVERERGSLAAQIDWNLNTTTIPYLRASWGHEFGDDDVETIASFNGTSAQFTTAEEVMDTDGFTAGFGLNIVNEGSLEGSFGYDYSENGDYDSDLLHARLLMRF